MSLATITGGGVFSNQNIRDINANFLAVSPKPDIWVRPQYGVDSNPGTYEKPKATMAGCASLLRPGIVVGLLGVLKEEYTGPIIGDVTIVGMGNQPRQATTSGVPNGGGATWLSPTGGTGHLCTVQGQGWRLQNIFFNNSATAAAGVRVLTTGDPPTLADGAHIQILNCIFTGTDDGVLISGGTNFVTIDGCTFFNFTGSGDCGINSTVGAGIGTNLGYKITNNYFYNNVNSIIIPSTTGFYIGNTFVSAGASVTATTLLSLTGGTGNVVMNNKFGLASDAAGIGTIAAYGTSPSAGPNFYNDQTEYGQPA